MKIAIINGSHRPNAQSAKVAAYLADLALSKGLADQVYRYDLTDNPLPFWDEGVWQGDQAWEERLQPISEELAASDGFVIVTPEWHGMVPSGLKNFFLLWSNQELAHKPALITSVSAGTGGAYPVAELRMSSYKNNRICYIPEQLIIRNVARVLNEGADNDPESDPYYRRRADYALGLLVRYASALQQMRSAGGLFDGEFKNGM
ncbi:MAG: NAD(P)H-dependent oxidoreductase [Gammaproteobacteria bacterium]|nr:NAD(P)H-dependent oxidoreductase [Gammaproteobacteria bacterium]MBU1656217.1 NAD(P)H-dependent oxidoreductase [Gammaproteobacteria bacterium]MBU1959782.1 NAD(P)H-dependent oxidoreductase [Gammaproteobacteria bacterium]